MKFGICYCYWNKNWEGTDYPKYISRARKCGFDALEIVYGRTMQMSQTEINEIRAACKAEQVELYATGGFGRDMDVASLDETLRRSAVDKSLELLQALARLDIHNFSGINYGAWCNFDTPQEKDAMFAQAARSLKEIGKSAADLGISWNMEVVNRFESCMLNTAEEAMRLVEMTDSPAINVLLDCFHGMIEENDLAQAVLTVGKERLGHYHMGSNNRRLPQPGFMPWQDICSALNQIGYDRCISFEPLVHNGGTVALNGGNVWRPMLSPDLTDEDLDRMLVESREFIESML